MNPSRILHAETFRYAVLYLTGVSLAVFVVLAIGYGWVTFGYFRDLNALIGAEQEALARVQAEGGRSATAAAIGERVQAAGVPRLFYLLVDAEGGKVAGNLSRWPERIGEGKEWVGLEHALEEVTGAPAAIDFIGSGRHFDDGSRLLVARHYKDISEFLRLALTVLLQAMLATIIVGAIGAALLSMRLKRLISEVNDSIATILAGDLSQRIPVLEDNRDDDFRRLIVNFNHMLDRIGQLMANLQQLSDNIAHDLRTPLTRLRNRIARLEFDDREARGEAVAGMLQESDDLLATFNALLRIAQIEAGGARSGFAPTDIALIVRDVCEFYEPLAAEKHQTVCIDLPPACPGVFDRDLLFQACANLLDNAIKYAPRDGHIEVTMRCAPETVELEFADDGPGIPPAERERVFERFYRVEASRSGYPGNGLGLSLVRAVGNLHGGSIELGDNAPGLRVVMRLPRQPARGELTSAAAAPAR
ncbi:MAG: Adaptive-response sensory-kinase SasA [Pseudomonadales bacterium]|nr:Adaptive-response sensory-kinase SasA [Pseudomonadales bacterium]